VKYRKLKQSGETIIEVLIAIAVLSGALGGAFAISTKSKNTVQANQERYQAQAYANEQADLLRSANAPGSATATTIYGYGASGKPFCINADGSVSAQSASLTVPAAGCTRGSGVPFDILVFPHKGSDNTGVSVDTFFIRVQWDSVNKSGKDQVEVGYGT
jgi:Tfp pilus assembly protein PilV